MDPADNEGSTHDGSTTTRHSGASGGSGAMTAPSANGRPTSPESLERELLARLGLGASATREDIAAAHEAVTVYLAAAPKGLRGWARAQAADADEAYALLTDPAALARAVALVGAGARPAVRPGGPATPPVHRDTPAPAAAAVVPTAAAAAPPADVGKATPALDENGRRIVTDDEIDALLAQVDPGARREVVGTPEERAAATRRLVDVEPAAAPRPSLLDRLAGSRTARNVALVGTTVAAIAIVAVVGFNIGAPSGTAGIGANATPAATAPLLDQAAVADLMATIQSNPQDADALMSLGDEYYKTGDYRTAADWFRKVTEVEPNAVRGFLALGAASFNQGDLDTAEAAWTEAAAIDDTNVEAHYDLGFLYLNRDPADMDAVRRHWSRVVELAPDSEIAKTVSAHLDAFASMPPASADPGASTAPGASAVPSATPAPSASPAPSVSPAP
jgi:cytochrome c-type biogenesis protein CcmH/NrfG